MPHVHVHSYDETAGIARREYDAVLRRARRIWNIVSNQSQLPEGLAKLREAGCDDRGISSATRVIAYFYINRIADVLGVPMEVWLDPAGTPREDI